MVKRAVIYPNPRFDSPDEEDKYWETHSPLDEGYKGEIQESKQKRSSFLSIRLTGDELTKLRDLSKSMGVPPSTLARQALTTFMNQITMNKSSAFQPPIGIDLPGVYDAGAITNIPSDAAYLVIDGLHAGQFQNTEVVGNLIRLLESCGVKFSFSPQISAGNNLIKSD